MTILIELLINNFFYRVKEMYWPRTPIWIKLPQLRSEPEHIFQHTEKR